MKYSRGGDHDPCQGSGQQRPDWEERRQIHDLHDAERVRKASFLNAWTGRSDLARLRHINEFNQSAGRSLGFREKGDTKLAFKPATTGAAGTRKPA